MFNNKIKKQIENLEYIPVGRAKDLTGQIFGRLTVLGRAPADKRYAKWWCICSCEEHNIISVIGSHLLSGATNSCGCYNKEIVSKIGKKTKRDLTGQQFGELKVLEDDGTRDEAHRSIKWKCQCSCGKVVHIRSDRLIGGDAWSCGCQKQSQGEAKIRKILTEANIKFICEYSPKDFHYDNNLKSYPRFDFYLPDYNKIIEFDGMQHFQESSTKFFGDFKKQQNRDEAKNQYCKEHNIDLLRVPYWDIGKIDLEYLGLN